MLRRATRAEVPVDRSLGTRWYMAFLGLTIVLGVYLAALEYAYRAMIAPSFEYLGYFYTEPSRLWMLASFLILLVLSRAMPREVRLPGDYILWFLYVVVVAPIAIVPYYGSEQSPERTFLFGVFSAVVLAAVALPTRSREIRAIPINGGALAFWSVVVGFSVVTFLCVFVVFGLSITVVSPFEIYDTRILYRDEVAPTIPFLGYLINNQGNVINPILMGIGTALRRWYLVAAGVLGQLVLYTITGFRTALISIFIGIAVALLLRNSRRISGATIALAAAIIAVLSIVVDRISYIGAVHLIVSRVFITAGHLVPYYLEVFGSGPPMLWSHSFLSPFLSNPYGVSPGFYVGSEAFGRSDIQANASLFADGFANFGYLGILIEAAFLIPLLLLINSSARGLPLYVTIPAAILPSFALANASPFTAAVSHGLVLMAVLFALFPRSLTEAGSSLRIARPRSSYSRTPEAVGERTSLRRK